MFFGTSQEQLKAKASEIGEQLAELPAAKAQLLELSQQDSTVASDLKGLAARLEATESLVSNARPCGIESVPATCQQVPRVDLPGLPRGV